jgi:pSer/pThr/pTyr-binding forkhead associated (FHA) protein
MEIQLITENSITEEQEQQIFTLPLVFGREIDQLPSQWENQNATPIVLFDSSNQISRFHAVLTHSNGQIILEDKSSNGTLINEQKIVKQSQPINNGDIIQFGNYAITVVFLALKNQCISSSNSTIFNPDSSILPASTQPIHISSASSQYSHAVFDLNNLIFRV